VTIIDEVAELKKKRNAVILAHNYQEAEIQDIADFVGDSLELARRAASENAETIVFCGVEFMAETAKLLAPGRTVLLPRADAGCMLADQITADDLREMRKEHPKAKVVCYVNTSAEVKAESDICCTSSNAVKVVESLDADEIIFVPDRNLAAYVQDRTQKRIIPWNGFCAVHERYSASEVASSKVFIKDAPLLVHPECRPEVVAIADMVLSTSGMVDYVSRSAARRFIIATENGILHRMKKLNPLKEFHPAGGPKTCLSMKKTRLEDLRAALAEMKFEITVPADVAEGASNALLRMLEASS
jgi:quinolinate synthase